MTSDTGIIHGVGLNATDVNAIVKAKAKVIWSPRTNIDLYGNTTEVTLMKAMGVTLGLGTDWLPSGSMNMLRELACVDSLNGKYFGNLFDDHAIVDLATIGSAQTLELDGAIGSLVVGKLADIAVFSAVAPATDCRAVIEASPQEVLPVLRGGKALFGVETAGVTVADIEAAAASSYPLFYCRGETPKDEPSCVPNRDTYPNGRVRCQASRPERALASPWGCSRAPHALRAPWGSIGAMLRPASLALVLALALALVACDPPSSPSATPVAASSQVISAAPSAPPPAAASASVAVSADAGAAAKPELDIIYVPTPQKVVDKMLEVAKVTKSDVVYDLGCGDGRIVVSAAKKLGAHGFGFDLDPERVKEANENVAGAHVGPLVTIKQENVFSVDLSPATVVTLYLLPEINVKLIPQLEKMRPGSRIVSHDFDMPGVIPDGHWTVTAPEFVDEEGYSAWKGAAVPEDKKNYAERTHEIYLWTIPLKKGSADAGAKK